MASLCVGVAGPKGRGKRAKRAKPESPAAANEHDDDTVWKRKKTAPASTFAGEQADLNQAQQQPASTITILQELAAGWIEQEMTWYAKNKNTSTFAPIDNKGKKVVDSTHIANARNEYAERFAFCTEEEDAAAKKYSGSPYLLVATNVQSTWSSPKKFASKFRFMLVPMQDEQLKLSALFITFMPGVVLGTVVGAFSIMIGNYLENNNLEEFVHQAHSGGGTYQPDIRLFPEVPDPNPTGPPDLDQDYDRAYSRVVVEFEFGNRNASALRQVGFAALHNDYGSLFVGIKIWKKTAAGIFGAALVVWEKDHATGTMNLRQAFDFGTKELTTQTKNAWSGAGANMLPPVPVGSWLCPLPIHAVVARHPIGQAQPQPQQAWSLVLPKNRMFYRMPSSAATGAGPPVYIPDALPALQDCVIDLRKYQRKVDSILG